MMMKLMVSVGFLFIAVGLPALEVSPTHVFNPTWPPHARFHEVWQLLTNAGVAAVGLWLVWRRGDVRLAGVLGALVMGGAVAASSLGGLYGGAIVYEGGPSAQALGMHVAILVPAVLLVVFLGAAVLPPHGVGARSR